MLVLFVAALWGSTARAEPVRSIAGAEFQWPSAEAARRTLLLQDYNTRMIFLGTALLGVAAALVGTFMLLRRRALVGDVVSHAALPGIAVAFLVGEALAQGSGRAVAQALPRFVQAFLFGPTLEPHGKSLPLLLIGGAASGLGGILCALAIRRWTRIKEDAALAIVLSLFFGLGVSLLTIIQRLPSGSAAGLNQFIYGSAASMTANDVWIMAVVAALALGLCVMFTKEFSLLCFDEQYAVTQGWPAGLLDVLLTAMVVGVTVVGLQSVGLLLVVALLVMPAASARFWTQRLSRMLWLAALLGGSSAGVGVLLSALFPRLAAGAIIVLTGSLVFFVSLFFGNQRGVLQRWRMAWSLAERVGRHDLLRAMFECGEALADTPRQPVSKEKLLANRTWSASRLNTLLRRATQQQLVEPANEAQTAYRLTAQGRAEANRVVHNHRLWELFLITHADIAPSRVDHSADRIEHVLDPDLIEELEALLQRSTPSNVPPSPHELTS